MQRRHSSCVALVAHGSARHQPAFKQRRSAPVSTCFLRFRPTHHSDGEVVVDDAVRHRVPSLVLVCGRDIDLPAVQHQLGAVLDVPHYLQEALALVTSGRRR